MILSETAQRWRSRNKRVSLCFLLLRWRHLHTNTVIIWDTVKKILRIISWKISLNGAELMRLHLFNIRVNASFHKTQPNIHCQEKLNTTDVFEDVSNIRSIFSFTWFRALTTEPILKTSEYWNYFNFLNCFALFPKYLILQFILLQRKNIFISLSQDFCSE